MGILNVTPDSFSDGGRFVDVSCAVAHGLQLIADGADVIDVGGESTRPGSAPVPPAEQIRRVIPVIRGLRERGAPAPLSIDTRCAAVAEAAIDAGAELVNDISALRDDPQMADLCGQHRVGVILMHMQGAPATMQSAPVYANVLAEVAAFLRERATIAETRGIARDRIMLDPGIGFGKSFDHNLALLHGLPALGDIGPPLLVGASRKAFLGALTGETDAARRDAASVAAALWCAAAGAFMVRVHNVSATRQAFAVWQAVAAGRE